ncbi:hypothetical protein ASF72_18320 [Arthrobacter sp. Leaf141]|nr:hypothetical protein ASF72_18320 [Arthrobacter sp. Leaf141]
MPFADELQGLATGGRTSARDTWGSLEPSIQRDWDTKVPSENWTMPVLSTFATVFVRFMLAP